MSHRRWTLNTAWKVCFQQWLEMIKCECIHILQRFESQKWVIRVEKERKKVKEAERGKFSENGINHQPIEMFVERTDTRMRASMIEF